MSRADVLLRLRATAKQAKKEVKKMGKEMKTSLQQDLNSNISIEDHGEIKKTTAELKRLSRDQRVNVNPKLNKAQKKKVEAQLKKLEKDYGVSKDKGGNFQEDHGFAKNQNALKSSISSNTNVRNRPTGADGKQYQHLKNIKESVDESKKAVTGSLDDINTSTPQIPLPAQKRFVDGRFGRDVTGSKGRRGLSGSTGDRGFQATSRSQEEINQSELIGDNLKKPTGFEKTLRNVKKKTSDISQNFDVSELHMGRMKEHGKVFTKNFKKYSPNIMMWWKLVALLLPMMIALRVQAAGVAASMMAIGKAGQAMVMGGLLGHGEGIDDSLDLMERRINELKREFFQVFQPVFKEFAPISERFLGTLASKVQPLVSTLQRLTEFEGAFFRMFDDVIHEVNSLVNHVFQYVDDFEQIGRRFFMFAIQRAERLMDFLFATMVEEQDVMMDMVDTFTSVLNIVWQVLKLVSQAGAMLAPVLMTFSKLATILSNKILVKLASATLALLMFIVSINTLRNAIIMLKGMNIVGWFMGIVTGSTMASGALAKLTAWWTAMGTRAKWAWAMASLGATLAVTSALSWATDRMSPSVDDFGGGVGGDPTFTGRRSGGSGSQAPTYNTTINVEGETSKRQTKRMEDVARKVGDERESMNSDRSL